MTETQTQWQFPLDDLVQAHRERIPGEGHEDMVPALVEAWMEGDDGPVWTAWIGDTNGVEVRDAALTAADIMASAAGADYILLSIDTHATSLPNNPKTGKPWGHGEMQAMCDEEGFCETGQMRDNLLLAVIRRSDKKIAMRMIAYHFHGDGTVMYFDPEPGQERIDEWADAEFTFQGIIPDGLRAIMSKPTITDVVTSRGGYEAMGFEKGEIEDGRITQLHQILGGARVLMMLGMSNGSPEMYLNIIPARNKEEMEIIRESAEHAGATVHVHGPRAPRTRRPRRRDAPRVTRDP